jgi:ribosome biogenesis GTPase A
MPKKNNKTGIKHLEKNHINWFPGHMNKAIKEIKNRIKQVSIVIEVRDARAPMTSGNQDNYYGNGEKPYLIVLNKTNLADPEAVKLWKEWFIKKNEPFIFINALDKSSIKAIVKRSKEIIQAHRLKSNATTAGKEKIKMMILGLPNTGKSTIINSLANRNASKAAATPGQTTTQLWVKVDKNLEILDTPGVMPPKVNKKIQGMWLSAIHAIPDHVVTPDYSACFIIEHLLKIKSDAFKEHYKFEALDVDLLEACNHIAKTRGCLRSGGDYDYDHVYRIVLNDFRKGLLGLTCFELPPKNP